MEDLDALETSFLQKDLKFFESDPMQVEVLEMPDVLRGLPSQELDLPYVGQEEIEGLGEGIFAEEPDYQLFYPHWFEPESNFKQLIIDWGSGKDIDWRVVSYEPGTCDFSSNSDLQKGFDELQKAIKNSPPGKEIVISSIQEFEYLPTTNRGFEILTKFRKDDYRLLWHGTTIDNSLKILTEGFKRSSIHTNFGTGVYFSGLHKAMHYTKLEDGVEEGVDGFRTIFLCRIISKNTRYYEPKENDPYNFWLEKDHDSACGFIFLDWEFVVYNIEDILPIAVFSIYIRK